MSDNTLNHIYTEPDQVMKAHESADMNEKSVHESRLLGHFSKSDVRYWTRSIFRRAHTICGQRRYIEAWYARMRYGGQRDSFLLQTPNHAVASATAQHINLQVLLYVPLLPRRRVAHFKVGRSDLFRLQRSPRRVSNPFPARIANSCLALALHMRRLRTTR